MRKENRVSGTTIVYLYKDNEFIKRDQFMNIIGYLRNRQLIDLSDEYLIEEDNGWKSYFRKNYSKIFADFSKLTNKKYEVRRR